MVHTASIIWADSETWRQHVPPIHQYPPTSQNHKKIWMKNVKLYMNSTQRNGIVHSKFLQLIQQFRTWIFKYSWMWKCVSGWEALYAHDAVSHPTILESPATLLWDPHASQVRNDQYKYLQVYLNIIFIYKINFTWELTVNYYNAFSWNKLLLFG